MSSIEQMEEEYTKIILGKYNLNQRTLAQISLNNINNNKKPIYTADQIKQLSKKTKQKKTNNSGYISGKDYKVPKLPKYPRVINLSEKERQIKRTKEEQQDRKEKNKFSYDTFVKNGNKHQKKISQECIKDIDSNKKPRRTLNEIFIIGLEPKIDELIDNESPFNNHFYNQ